MRVAVTGATGYVGAHSVAALRRAGHEVRVLLHPTEAAVPLAEFGLDPALDTVVGDVCDPDAVAALLDGADALLHMAGVVAVDDRREALMWRVNVEGTRAVVGAAVAAGLDPVVHVSSYAALFPSPTGVIDADTPPAEGRSAYARTKSAAEQFLRGRQAAGAPIVITYPSSVVGPGLGSRPGISAEGWTPLLRSRVSVTFPGGMAMIDVRDVADLHAAVMRPGQGPRRLPCGGEMVGFDEMLDTLERARGRRLRRVRVSARMFRAMGRSFDAVARVLPLPPVFSYEAARLLTQGQPTDDSGALAVLGRGWRDPRAALAEAVRAVAPPARAPAHW